VIRRSATRIQLINALREVEPGGMTRVRSLGALASLILDGLPEVSPPPVGLVEAAQEAIRREHSRRGWTLPQDWWSRELAGAVVRAVMLSAAGGEREPQP
jgi:hypothetical protein